MIADHQQQRLLDLAIWLGLILSIAGVYAQVADFDFVVYDDGPYVYQEPHVQAGLTVDSIKWALTSEVLSNWMPVTLLSHIVDAQLFGMQSGMHHLVNVLFHALAAGLLYAALKRATGARGMSAFVAFMFALHPLSVGSVAWIAERKGILGALFWFLAVFFYVRYVERPGLGRYLLVVAAFCLGLMSKPILITFPFTLLLLDVWPLRRSEWRRMIGEKVPLFALSALSAVLTYFIQGSTGAVSSIPFKTRIANAFLSYIIYIRQMFWPDRLAVFYPYPQSIPAWQGALAAAVVLGVSALAILAWRARPYFTVGWFWYIGTLVPVIGFVQVGSQGHADRYMYVPMVGLLLIVAGGAAEIMKRWPRIQPAIATAAVLFCAASMLLARKETAYWQNSQTLFERNLEVTPDNWLAHGNLGVYLLRNERRAEAVSQFEAALRIRPDYPEAETNLGVALKDLEDCAAATPHFEAALRIQPDFNDANFNLGACQLMSGSYAAAIPHFEAVIRGRPGDGGAHARLALCLSKIPGRVPDAIREYETALRLTPEDSIAQSNLRALLDRQRTESR